MIPSPPEYRGPLRVQLKPVSHTAIFSHFNTILLGTSPTFTTGIAIVVSVVVVTVLLVSAATLLILNIEITKTPSAIKRRKITPMFD